MSDISKSQMKKEIADILKDADLDSMSSKKVRQQLEEKLKCDLSDRKKEIDDLVMEYVESQQDDDDKEDESEEQSEEEKTAKKKPAAKKPAPKKPAAKKRKQSDEEDEPSESEGESEEEKPKKRTPAKPKPAPKKRKPASDSEEESAASESNSDDDDYRPSKGAKGKKAKKGKAGKKKKGSDSDEGSDEDWKASKAKKAGGAKKGAGGGRGYAKPLKLSPELSDLMGEEVAPRHEVVKKVWALIKERNLYDPKNKQFAICDDQFFKVFGVKRFRTFGMMKLLKDHFITE